MSMSDITVSEEVVTAYQEIKVLRKYTYVVCNVSDDLKTIGVENKVASSTYDEFLSKVPADDCRFYIYDFKHEKEGGETREQLILISWCPDEAPVKRRMAHAAGKQKMQDALSGLQGVISGRVASDITEDAVIAQLGN